MQFPLYKKAELGQSRKRIQSGEYLLAAVPKWSTWLDGELELAGAGGNAKLKDKLTLALFDAFEDGAKKVAVRTRDSILDELLTKPENSGKNRTDPAIQAEATKILKQERSQDLSAEAVLAYANSAGDSENYLSAICGDLGEFHNTITTMVDNPTEFENLQSLVSIAKKRQEIVQSQSKVTSTTEGTKQTTNAIMEYICANPKVSDELTIEAFGATPESQTNPEARAALEERCKTEQAEGGGVCVHSVHHGKVQAGLSVFASVRLAGTREHFATIKFENGHIYEIKGFNNKSPGSQLKAIPPEKMEQLRLQLREYLNRMVADDVVEGYHDTANTDYGNLTPRSEIAAAVSGELADCSGALASPAIKTDQMQTIWKRIKADKDRDPQILNKELLAMAGNSSTPADIQTQLHSLNQDRINIALTKNKNLGPAIHDSLIDSKYDVVRHKAYAHPKLGYRKEISERDLQKMLESRDSSVLARAVAVPGVSEEQLIAIADRPNADPNVLANMLLNPGLPLEKKQIIFNRMPASTQVQIKGSSEYGARSDDIAELEFSPDILDKTIDHADGLIIARSTKNSNILAGLTKHPDPDVRRIVARNRSTPPEVLATLVKDSDLFVRRLVAYSLSIPPEALATLAKDTNPDVRRLVVSNRNTHPKVLATLAEDSDPGVRRSVASKTNTHPKVLATLAKDSSPDVREAARATLAELARKSATASTYIRNRAFTKLAHRLVNIANAADQLGLEACADRIDFLIS